MEWQDQGILLSARPHGESSLIVYVLTERHGRYGGLVRGGASRKNRATFQLGNRLAVNWRARLPEQLGSFTVELAAANAALVLDRPARLAALTSACSLIEKALPDRDPYPDLYNLLCELIDRITTSGVWAKHYVWFELALLTDLGFGLDFSSSQAADLVYVSPKTGRAVTRAMAKGYESRLLPLPHFLVGGGGQPAGDDILAGLRLTGFFLERHVFAALDRPLPEPRKALVNRLSRDINTSRKG